MTKFKEYQYFLDAKSDKSPLTIKSYSIICEKFFEAMEIDSVEKLSTLKANEIRSYIIGLKVSPNTKNGVTRVLKLFFSWLYKNDYLEFNQMLKIDKQKIGKRPIKMPTNAEMDIIYSNCKNETTSLLINLMSRMGLRREETTNIRIEDISEDGKILVRGKGNKQAVLKMPQDIFIQINKYIKHKNRKDSEFLFSYDGNKVSPTSINKRIKAYISELTEISDERKKIITPHSFRRRCGTNVYKKTQNPYAVKAILRHSSLSVGELYVSPEQEEFDCVSMTL